METTKRTIEVCSNNEWLEVYGPLCDLDVDGDRSAGDDWFNRVCRRLEDELDVETEAARGQRSMCHGWNGANTFARKGSGLGTFYDFTDEEWDRAEEIACEVANEVIADAEAAIAKATA